MNCFDEFKKSDNEYRHSLLLAVVLSFVGPAQPQIDKIIVTANKRAQTIDIIYLQTAVPALRIN